jgi:hypothetical protein
MRAFKEEQRVRGKGGGGGGILGCILRRNVRLGQ